MFRSDLVISDEVRWDQVRSNRPDPFDLDLEGIPLGLKIRSDPIRSIISDLVWSDQVRSEDGSKFWWQLRLILGRILSRLGPSWGCLGCRLGTSWGCLESRLELIGRSVWPIRPAICFFEFFGGLVGFFLGPSWRSLGPSCRPRWYQNRKKSIPKSIEIWMPLGIGILSDLLKFLVQKWRQVGIKIDLKSMISSKDDF